MGAIKESVSQRQSGFWQSWERFCLEPDITLHKRPEIHWCDDKIFLRSCLRCARNLWSVYCRKYRSPENVKKNKKYYYQAKHFTAVSGMVYRMKQNAVGLANICILSTMVLIMVSTTVCLYVGMNDIISVRYPRECEVTIYRTNITDRRKSAYDH